MHDCADGGRQGRPCLGLAAARQITAVGVGYCARIRSILFIAVTVIAAGFVKAPIVATLAIVTDVGDLAL
ncbi:hypothetical protein GCM10010170_025360 [Dactylosporangium salmoneum]|uniref:Uncharacterized protein n=1 Tax=Dactylosporangium salmoneum TaxID=53361 RepID=A0ABN3G0L4_9ACTN